MEAQLTWPGFLSFHHPLGLCLSPALLVGWVELLIKTSTKSLLPAHPSHIQTSSKPVCLQWEMEPVGVPRCMPFGPWGLPFALLCELQGCVPMRRSLCIYTEKSIFKYWDKIFHGKRYRFFTKDFWSSLCQQQLKMCRLHGWQRM